MNRFIKVAIAAAAAALIICGCGCTQDQTTGDIPDVTGSTADATPAADETANAEGRWACTPEPPKDGQQIVPPVSQYGQLQVIGSQLSSQSGDPVVLRGVSSHGLHWYGEFVNKDSIEWLMKDWCITIFRASMYTGEGGYIEDPSVKEKLFEAVDACIDLGLYVIIDWHMLEERNPMSIKTEAIAFFDEVSKKYGEYPNVLYEIMNEPNGRNVTWNQHCKPYAEELISTIRANDPDNIIIVGNPRWSSFPQEVMDSPLTGDYAKNICYTYHLYTNTDQDGWHLNQLEEAMEKGMCIFVSEWGAMDDTGDGELGKGSGNTFIRWMEKRKVSWVCWSLSDKKETCAFLKRVKDPTNRASFTGGWTQDELSPNGVYVRSKIRDNYGK